MFNRISGLYINDGNFYNVSGGLNIQSHQQLTFQDQQGHMERIQSEWDATRAQTDGRQEEYGRELSGVSRNVRHGISERSVPYGVSKISIDIFLLLTLCRHIFWPTAFSGKSLPLGCAPRPARPKPDTSYTQPLCIHVQFAESPCLPRLQYLCIPR